MRKPEMDLERIILMSRLRTMDWQARDGPRKENTDVPVAAVGWASQMDLEKRTVMDLERRILMVNERRILMFQLWS